MCALYDDWIKELEALAKEKQVQVAQLRESLNKAKGSSSLELKRKV